VSDELQDRLPVRRTAKLFVGGRFPRSESGRTFEIHGSDGALLAHAARASRKDLRDAIVAARGAQRGWAGATAYNRGQVLYRVAELMEGRRPQFEGELADAGVADPAGEVSAAIDRWVWYAGWSDKIAQVLGGSNPVAGPYFNFSVPEPTGVVGIVAPEEPPLLGLVSRLAPAVVPGNAVVAVVPERAALAAVSLSEVLATSDVPGGVINLLTGVASELTPWLCGHMDVNAVDLTGCPPELAAEAEALAAENVKRVHRAPAVDAADPRAQSPYEITALMEIKTVWHPMGA
jgi:acyl-CoA reductase-like NAD-dependent aldehyde dehydrogenase